MTRRILYYLSVVPFCWMAIVALTEVLHVPVAEAVILAVVSLPVSIIIAQRIERRPLGNAGGASQFSNHQELVTKITRLQVAVESLSGVAESIQSELAGQRILAELEGINADVREIRQALVDVTAAVDDVRGVVEDSRTEARVGRLRAES